MAGENDQREERQTWCRVGRSWRQQARSRKKRGGWMTQEVECVKHMVRPFGVGAVNYILRQSPRTMDHNKPK